MLGWMTLRDGRHFTKDSLPLASARLLAGCRGSARPYWEMSAASLRLFCVQRYGREGKNMGPVFALHVPPEPLHPSMYLLFPPCPSDSLPPPQVSFTVLLSRYIGAFAELEVRLCGDRGRDDWT